MDINGLEALLYSLHAGVASISKTPELAMEKEEARMLAEATANVARHYDLGATQKHLDWSNLISVAAMVYGTRMYAIRTRKTEEKRAEAATPIHTPIITGV